MPDYSRELATALQFAEEAGRLAMKHFGRDLEPERKADGSWVTEADKAVESLLRERLADSFPDHNILGEEEGLTKAAGGEPLSGAPTWVIDPIDGTNNFLNHVPIWATLIALRVDNTSVLGVCHAPAIGETYDAARGAGARCNGAPIRVDQTATLADSTVVFASVQRFGERGLDDFFNALIAASWRSRGFGDFWGHMLVARGAVQVMVEPELSIWDVAALEPIVAEAGGTLTTLSGTAFSDGLSCLTTNGLLHDQVQRLVRENAQGWSD
jgi:histidinol-phosphatase